MTSSTLWADTVLLDAPDRAVSTSFQWGVKKADNLQDLCDAYGLMYGVKLTDAPTHYGPSIGGDPVEVYTGADL